MAIMPFECSVYFSRAYWLDRNNDPYTVAETIMSPAKYALFQFLGYHFIRATFLKDAHSNLNATFSARIGASGGFAFAFLHISLLLLRRNFHQSNLADDEPFSKYVLLLCKEMVYSAAASVVGALVSGLRDYHTLSSLAMAGLSGPLIFLAILFGMLGLVIGTVWAVDRLRTWWWWTQY